MKFINLIRAHIFNHSSAALQLGKYDLAKTIALKKLENAQQRQIALLKRLEYVKAKIANGGIFTWYYKFELRTLTKKLDVSKEKTSQLVAKYMERAVVAQGYIEARSEQQGFGRGVTNTRVFVMPDLTPIIATLSGYTTANKCFEKAGKYLRHTTMVYPHKQTLDSTVEMAATIMHNLNVLCRAKYLVNRASSFVLVAIDDADELERASNAEMSQRFLSFIGSEIRANIENLWLLAKNMIHLTKHLDRSLEHEVKLVEDILASIDKVMYLYGQLNDTDNSLNVFSQDEKDALRDYQKRIQDEIYTKLNR